MANPAPSPLERKLTSGEIQLAQSIFGNSIDYSGINIYREFFIERAGVPHVNQLMAPDGNIYAHPSSNIYRSDYSMASIELQATFLHELVHIWQLQHGMNVQAEAIGLADVLTLRYPPDVYEYSLQSGISFFEYSLEQQGAIIEDYFLVSNGYPPRFNTDYTGSASPIPPTVRDYLNAIPGAAELEAAEFETDYGGRKGECFAAGTPVRMADGSEKSIEQLKIGEWVLAFDSEANHGRGALIPSQVTRTMVNHGQLLLNFHGTKVTPGHVFLTGDESPSGKGVFKRLIDILIEDGTVVNAEGMVLRAATNFPIGSPEDRLVEIAEIWPENGSISSRAARLRAGTWLIAEDGSAVTLLDAMTREGFELLPDGRVSHRSGPSQPMLMQAPAPRPETFVLERSGLTLEQIYAHASLRDVEPAAIAARGLGQDGATAVRGGDESDGLRLGSTSDARSFRLSQGWTPSVDDENALPERTARSTANRAARRKASVEARKQAKQRLH